jgi:transcriptional regulator with XRE-family HTH domain
VHRTFIGTVERGETNISLENIARIAKGLGMTLAEFFTEVERDSR